MRVKVSHRADRELENIIRWGVEHFGRTAAIGYYQGLLRVFDLLADSPSMAKEIRRDVRAHPHRSHVIIYRPGDAELEILSVRHGHSNWRKHL